MLSLSPFTDFIDFVLVKLWEPWTRMFFQLRPCYDNLLANRKLYEKMWKQGALPEMQHSSSAKKAARVEANSAVRRAKSSRRSISKYSVSVEKSSQHEKQRFTSMRNIVSPTTAKALEIRNRFRAGGGAGQKTGGPVYLKPLPVKPKLQYSYSYSAAISAKKSSICQM